MKVDFHLQPLTSIHLHSDLQIDLPGKGNIQYVKIFFIVDIFILLVACINFMNLSTARSERRAKEVGLRKVVGASRIQLMMQFLGESLVIYFLSLIIAVGIVWLLLSAFNNLADKNISFRDPLMRLSKGIDFEIFRPILTEKLMYLTAKQYRFSENVLRKQDW